MPVTHLLHILGDQAHVFFGKSILVCFPSLISYPSYFLAIKYGKTSLELAKGKFSVVCKDITEVKNSLVVIRDAVQRGEFDDNLEKHSKEIRKNFNRW